MPLNNTIERIEKIRNFCEDTSVELSLFANETNFTPKTVIKWLDRITIALDEITIELHKERNRYK